MRAMVMDSFGGTPEKMIAPKWLLIRESMTIQNPKYAGPLTCLVTHIYCSVLFEGAPLGVALKGNQDRYSEIPLDVGLVNS